MKNIGCGRQIVNAFHTCVCLCIRPCVRLSGFNINLNISFIYKDIFIKFAGNVYDYKTRAATILRLLGNETIQFNTRGKKSKPGLRKQLNIDVKSSAKLILFFKYMHVFIYFTNITHFCFSILYFKYLQTLILCVTVFYKTAFYYNVFRSRL